MPDTSRIVPSRCRRSRVIVKFRPENTKSTPCLLLNARTIKRIIIRLIMISPVYTGVRARPSRSRGCRSVRSRCRHARFVTVTFLRGFDGVIVFFFRFFSHVCSPFERNDRKKHAFSVVALTFWSGPYVVCRVNNPIAAARKALTTVGPGGVLRFTAIFPLFTNDPQYSPARVY